MKKASLKIIAGLFFALVSVLLIPRGVFAQQTFLCEYSPAEQLCIVNANYISDCDYSDGLEQAYCSLFNDNPGACNDANNYCLSPIDGCAAYPVTEDCSTNASLPYQCSINSINYCCSSSSDQCHPPAITPGDIPSGPFPEPYITCSDTNEINANNTLGPEYHSLRPYQASPCNQNLSELDLYCGNDIITRETFTDTLNSDNIVDCVDNGTQYICQMRRNSSINVNIDLTNAELPIAGNTQLVPNQINAGNPNPEQLSYATRMNNYISWYLQGAPWKADEELYDPDEINIIYPQRHLLTYAGPIRKLYPYNNNPYVHILPYWPYHETQFPPDPRGDRVGVTRRNNAHNQIYVCNSGGNQVPCRWNFETNRYELMDSNGTPLDPSDDYFTGIAVSPQRVLSSNANESPWMVYSSTEDRLGAVYTKLITVDPDRGIPIQPIQGQEGQQASITDITFTPDVDTDLLYFPHMEENVTLTALLQKTYVPRGVSSYDPGPPDPLYAYNTFRCDLPDVRWNSGDDLFGELDQLTGLTPVHDEETGENVTGQSITGTIDYTAEYTCVFNTSPEEIDTCIHNCASDINQCDPNNNPLIPDPYRDCTSYCENEICPSNDICETDALTATSVYTRTPKAEELWRRTVEGDASAVRRMFPKIGANDVNGELIKDYPAVTSANYGSTTSGVDVLAGDPGNNRPGSRAEIYIPHFGGIKVLFMNIMQDLLRPEEMNSQYLVEGPPPGSGGTCSVATSGACAPENLSPPWTPEQATAASQICQAESTGVVNIANTSCLQAGTYDFSVGLFQINLAPIYNPVTDTLRSRCDVWGFEGAFVTDLTDPTIYPGNGGYPVSSTLCKVPTDGTSCAGMLVAPNWDGACNQQLQECIQYVLDHQIDLAYGISNHGENWCQWSTASQANCGLCQN